MANELLPRRAFRALWAGSDPFVAVEALQGEVFRELEGAARCAPRSPGAAISSRSIAASAGARFSRTCSRCACRCSARPTSGRRSAAWSSRRRHHARRRLRPARRNPARSTRSSSPRNWRRPISLEDFCRDWPQSRRAGAQAGADRPCRRDGRAHASGGVNHRDFYICHFLLHLDPAPTPEAFQAVDDRPAPRAVPGRERRAAGATRIWQRCIFRRWRSA
jgi:heptose I phosphotransferase